MESKTFTPLKGHCTCKAITYEILAPFLCVHCCHCTWCQRETGSAFALNAIIESSNFRLTSPTQPICNKIASPSGDGQTLARCPECRIVVWSDYGDDGTWTKYVKVGTLDVESRVYAKPDVHLFTSTKMEWIDLTEEERRGVPVLEGYYNFKDVWREDALERIALLRQKEEKARNE